MSKSGDVKSLTLGGSQTLTVYLLLYSNDSKLKSKAYKNNNVITFR